MIINKVYSLSTFVVSIMSTRQFRVNKKSNIKQQQKILANLVTDQ